jgi:hypothetical protein
LSAAFHLLWCFTNHHWDGLLIVPKPSS